MTARRRMVLGLAAAGGAGALGLGVALWRERAAPSPHPVFTARFDRPDGGELVMASYLGRPLLLNFWATWCPPCIREMPLLGEFHRRQPAVGWQVVGLAADAGAPVREFIQRQPVPFAIGLAGFQGSSSAVNSATRVEACRFRRCSTQMAACCAHMSANWMRKSWPTSRANIHQETRFRPLLLPKVDFPRVLDYISQPCGPVASSRRCWCAAREH